MRTIPYSSGSSPLQMSDIMVFLQHGGLESAEVKTMIAKAKRNYVDSHHTQSITQLHSENKYKDGCWKTYVRMDGKRKEVVRKTEDELYQYLYDYYKSLNTPALTLEDAFNSLKQWKTEELGRAHKTVMLDTRRFSLLDSKLRKKPLSEITESDLRKWFVSSYMPTHPKEDALRKMLQLINQIFTYGISRKMCFINPAESILLDDYAKGCDLSRKTDEEREFSPDEIVALRQDAMNCQTNPRCLIRLLSVETGMRAGELCALHSSDVKGSFIHVHRQIIKDLSSGHQVFHEIGYTKNERQHPRNGRIIPRTDTVNAILKLAEQLPGDSDYIFHDKTGRFITPDSYEQNLRRACAKLGIQTSNNHAFRIARNSELIEKGLYSNERALILGHSVETNERRYSVSDSRRMNSIMHKLA